jgi:hypothetical protein
MAITKKPDATSNPALEKATKDLSEKISNLRRIKLYEALKRGVVVIGLETLPEGVILGDEIVSVDEPLPALTKEGADGMPVLFVFTTLAALKVHNPDVPHVYMESRIMLDMVMKHEFGGLIINFSPTGAWAGVPREDVKRILEG